MSILEELRARREDRARQLADESARLRQEELDARVNARREKMTRLGYGVGRNVRWLFGLITALVCGWSLYSLGENMGMPGWIGILAAAAIDGAWLYCLLHTHLNRDTPYRALGAHTTSQLLLGVSIALNVLHGFVMFTGLWQGLGAGLLFALFPVILKVIIAQSTVNPLAQILKVSGGRAAIRDMGRDRARSALKALQERDRIERYELARASEVELARLDLISESTVATLRAELEASVRTRPDASGLESASRPDKDELSAGQSGQEQDVTSSTGPDAVRTPDHVLPSTKPDVRPQAEIIRSLLDSGVPREQVPYEVLKLRPDAKEDSVRRAVSREIRSGGNHL